MKNSLVREIYSVEDLDILIKDCLQYFPENRIFTLEGDLGAGKTTFVNAFAKELEAIDDVSSPTFSLVNEYQYPSGKIIHMDLYRINSIEELLDIGFEDYLDDDNYIFIEWPTISMPLIEDYVRITIEILDAKRRKFIFEKSE